MTFTREPYPVSGVQAAWDGLCDYCDRNVRGTRVTRRNNGWVHITCHQERHE